MHSLLHVSGIEFIDCVCSAISKLFVTFVIRIIGLTERLTPNNVY